ncbi:MAG: GNAT family N-acetyltransferase [Deltaproteobacteria bacterium]|nr:GNAT family N-acetyltransferase [Deltaproteobacteria bacterium]
MEIRGITKADWDHIVSVLDRWWGGPSRDLAHPVLFYELGQLGMVADDGGAVIGFLLGFLAEPTGAGAAADPAGPAERTAYIHLVGIHPDHRRRGVGKLLYEAFLQQAERRGATRAKAITNVGNEGSVDFHRALGFEVIEDANYAGPGRGRIVFVRHDLRGASHNEQ